MKPIVTALIESAGLWLLFYFIGLQGYGPKVVRAAVALPFALAIAFLPIGLSHFHY